MKTRNSNTCHKKNNKFLVPNSKAKSNESFRVSNLAWNLAN